jgi:hypothetical protein
MSAIIASVSVTMVVSGPDSAVACALVSGMPICAKKPWVRGATSSVRSGSISFASSMATLARVSA